MILRRSGRVFIGSQKNQPFARGRESFAVARKVGRAENVKLYGNPLTFSFHGKTDEKRICDNRRASIQHSAPLNFEGTARQLWFRASTGDELETWEERGGGELGMATRFKHISK